MAINLSLSLSLSATGRNVGVALSVAIDPSEISENGGETTATFTLSSALEDDLEITLSAAPSGFVTLPSSVTITAGQLSNTATITGVDNGDFGENPTVTITANSSVANGAGTVVVLDDDTFDSSDLPSATYTRESDNRISGDRSGTNPPEGYEWRWNLSDFSGTPPPTQFYVPWTAATFTTNNQHPNNEWVWVGIFEEGAAIGAEPLFAEQRAFLEYTAPVVDPSVITLTISPMVMPENGTSTGTITLDEPANGDTTITLSSSDTGEATVPASVDVLDGETTATFTITGVSDNTADGPQSATISATAAGLTGDSATITISDIDAAPTSITLTAFPLSFAENGTSTGTVTLDAEAVGNTTINLSSSDTGEATVPSTVTVLDGETTETFTITGVSDSTSDGPQIVTITASATGLTGDTAVVTVTDIDATPGALGVSSVTVTGAETYSVGSTTLPVSIGITGPANATVDVTGYLYLDVFSKVPGNDPWSKMKVLADPNEVRKYLGVAASPGNRITGAQLAAGWGGARYATQTPNQIFVSGAGGNVIHWVDLGTADELRFGDGAKCIFVSLDAVRTVSGTDDSNVVILLSDLGRVDYSEPGAGGTSTGSWAIMGCNFRGYSDDACRFGPNWRIEYNRWDAPITVGNSWDNITVYNSSSAYSTGDRVCRPGFNPLHAEKIAFATRNIPAGDEPDFSAGNIKNHSPHNGTPDANGWTYVDIHLDLAVWKLAEDAIFRFNIIDPAPMGTAFPEIRADLSNPNFATINGLIWPRNGIQDQAGSVAEGNVTIWIPEISTGRRLRIQGDGGNNASAGLSYVNGWIDVASFSGFGIFVSNPTEDAYGVVANLKEWTDNSDLDGPYDQQPFVALAEVGNFTVSDYPGGYPVLDLARMAALSGEPIRQVPLFEQTVTLDGDGNGSINLSAMNVAYGLPVKIGLVDQAAPSVEVLHDAGVLLASPNTAPTAITVTVADAAISETGGSTTGTVTLNAPAAGNVTVNLSSSDTSEATVPSSVTVLGGQSSATFAITGVGDSDVDGDVVVTITASATGLTSGTTQITVQDDDVATPPPSGDVAYTAYEEDGTALQSTDGIRVSTDGGSSWQSLSGAGLTLTYDAAANEMVLSGFASAAQASSALIHYEQEMPNIEPYWELNSVAAAYAWPAGTSKPPNTTLPGWPLSSTVADEAIEVTP